MARRSAVDAARTRGIILAAARRLFAEHGFAATTTAAVAAESGVTVGALFHHFGDKAGLFRRVFEAVENDLEEHIRRAADPAGGLEAFLDGFRAYLLFARRADFHRIVLLEGPAVMGEAEWHAIDIRRGAATLMEGLEALVAEGVVEDRPLRPLGLLLLGAMTEAGHEVARGTSRRQVDELVEAMRYLLAPGRVASSRTPRAATPLTRRRVVDT